MYNMQKEVNTRGSIAFTTISTGKIILHYQASSGFHGGPRGLGSGRKYLCSNESIYVQIGHRPNQHYILILKLHVDHIGGNSMSKKVLLKIAQVARKWKKMLFEATYDGMFTDHKPVYAKA